MRFFPISFSSHVRGLAQSSRRFYAVPALANPRISYSESEQDEKEGKFEIRVLRDDDAYLASSSLNRIEVNSVQAYARIVSRLGLNQKLVPFFVELISKGDERRGFSVSDLLDAIEEENGETSTSLVSSALVKAYAHLEMFEQAINVFYSCPLSCGPDVKALNFLLHRMIASGEYDMVVACFLQLGKLGFDADAQTCTLLVRALCNEMRIDDAEALVYDMERRGIDQNMWVYSAIVEGHRKKMDFLKALLFFENQVDKKGRTINCSIASSVLQCCCQMGKFSEAYDLFKIFRDRNVSFDRVCYNVAFDALGKLGHVEEAIDLFREMTGKGIAPDVINYTTLIGGCFRQKKIDKARDLMTEMEGRGITPDIFAYSVVAEGLARNDCALEPLKDVMKDRGIKPTSFTHSMIIEGLVSAGHIDKATGLVPSRHIDKAKALYESLEHKSQEVDASMVKAYCKAGRLDQAFELFAKLEFPLHKNVYRTLVTSLCDKLKTNLCAKDDYAVMAQYVVDRMSKLGVEPGKSMFGMLIDAWCRVNKVRKARQNFNVLLLTRGIIPDLFTYTKMINIYCRLNDRNEAYAFFHDMKQKGIVPDVKTYTVLVNHDPESDMKREMKAGGVKQDVYYYTVLIDRQCKIGDVEEAERLFDEMAESGVKPDLVAYTALLVGYCRNGCVHKADELMQEMREKKIEPTKASKELVKYAKSKARRLRSRK